MAFVSKNIFDLLGDNDAPAAAQAPKPAAKKADAPAPSARAVPGAAPRGGARGGRPSGNRPAHTTTRDNRVADNEGAETASGFDGERAPANKKANHVRDAHTKGPRGGRQNKTSGGHTSSGAGHYKGGKVVAQAGERRQFDRKNASGTTDSAKKTEHGWGATTGAAELKDEVAGEKDAQAEETAPQTPAEDTAAAPEPEAEEEPEEVTKSYEEYLAEKAEESARLANLGKKQGREVSGDVEGKAFVREALDDFFSGKTKTAETKSKPKKEKVHIAIDGQFAQPSRPPRRDDRENNGERRERGERPARGRGGPRGAFAGQRGQTRGGPRGGRGGRSAGPAINANDTNAFPALGA
ncbi:hypothetical protein IAR50_006724 [Cryptococcus sp. DSM 104548]